MILATFNLWSANAFNLVQSKKFSFGKELKESRKAWNISEILLKTTLNTYNQSIFMLCEGNKTGLDKMYRQLLMLFKIKDQQQV